MLVRIWTALSNVTNVKRLHSVTCFKPLERAKRRTGRRDYSGNSGSGRVLWGEETKGDTDSLPPTTARADQVKEGGRVPADCSRKRKNTEQKGKGCREIEPQKERKYKDSRNSFFQTTNQGPWPQTTSSLWCRPHLTSTTEQEGGGAGGGEAGEKKKRKPSALWKASDPEAYVTATLMMLLFAPSGGWGWGGRGGVCNGRDGVAMKQAAGSICSQAVEVNRKLRTKISKLKKIKDRQWSCTPSRHSSQSIEINQNDREDFASG